MGPVHTGGGPAGQFFGANVTNFTTVGGHDDNTADRPGWSPPAEVPAPEPNGERATPESGVATAFAEVLAGVLGRERVPSDGHFFDALGADSLLMARFCARVRKRPDLPPVSMKDIYRNSTIASLARAVADSRPAPVEPPVPAPVPVVKPATTREYVLCGLLQFLIFVGYSYFAALIVGQGFERIPAGSGLLGSYLRSVLVGGAGLVGMCVLPILVKWVLVGRWKTGRIRVWSLAYVRFWAVKTLVRSNPLVLFTGSPLYTLYLRALGAKVGRGALILSHNAPVCADLLRIGAGAVVRKDSFFTCYRANAGMIETGTVTIGRNAIVGETSVLDIETSLGDEAQLGHSSSLYSGMAVPDGEHWHGSPAQRAGEADPTVVPAAGDRPRQVAYTLLQIVSALLVYVPLTTGVLGLLFAAVPQVATLANSAQATPASWTFYRDASIGALVFLLGALLVGILLVAAVPRILNSTIRPDRVYPLYGFHYGVHRAITRLTNIKFLTRLFGDSSYIVHYLRLLGYDLSEVEQTGSNFGTEVRQDSPFLCSVGSGTMIADGLSIINVDYSSTSFRMSRASIGPNSFLGNRIAYPPQSRVGDNCLLATKVKVPVAGKRWEGVGSLGSRGMEMTRYVFRDGRVDDLKSGDEFVRRLRAKNRHNLVTIGLFLLTRWIYLFGVVVLGSAATYLYDFLGVWSVAAADILLLPFSVLYFTLVERAVTAFHPLRPLYCSIYDRRFWRRERFWKVPSEAILKIFDGTPFKNLVWRLLGVRIGRRVFDDGCYLTERTLATIGDDAMLNLGSIVQCHSQEDGTFKSDRITIGAGCTIGVGAFLHYGVTIGDGATLACDSFLMKGEEVEPHTRWGGNPAREIQAGPGRRRENPSGAMPAPAPR